MYKCFTITEEISFRVLVLSNEFNDQVDYLPTGTENWLKLCFFILFKKMTKIKLFVWIF